MPTRRPLILIRNVFISILLALILLAAVFVGFVLITNRNSPLNPFEAFALRVTLAFRNAEIERPAGTDSSVMCFTVTEGETAATVAQRLAQQGFAIDPDLFRNYARYYGLDTKIQAGVFSLSRAYNIPQLANRLSDARGNMVNFRVIEGWRLEEIAALIDQTPGLTYTGQDFLALVGPGSTSAPGFVADFATRFGIPAGRSLEGFLFPDTYFLPLCQGAFDLVTRMLSNFDRRVEAEIRSSAQARGLSMYQVVTLASIVQREAIYDDERGKIAGVYWRRWQNSLTDKPDATIPTTLDADPTIQYVLGNTRNASTWWPPLTAEDYRGVKSPYNTYLNRGLPPGPIASPGLTSIRAAANPEAIDANYFRACPGELRHRFSRTLEEQYAACPAS